MRRLRVSRRCFAEQRGSVISFRVRTAACAGTPYEGRSFDWRALSTPQQVSYILFLFCEASVVHGRQRGGQGEDEGSWTEQRAGEHPSAGHAQLQYCLQAPISNTHKSLFFHPNTFFSPYNDQNKHIAHIQTRLVPSI